ncbi:MAG: YdcF family protein [Blastocatellales bacterium]
MAVRLRFIRLPKSAKILLLSLVCFLLAYFLTPILLNKLAQSLIRRDKLERSDVIVALGGDHRCNREKMAAELYHQGWASNVVVNGLKYAWGFHTGEVAKRYLISLGVPESNISIISETLNTRAEAAALEKMMRERGWRSAIIVTSAFHSRRAMYTIEKAARDLTFHSAPVPTGAPEWQPNRWWARRDDGFVTAREFVSWANTLVNGWQ